MTDEGTSKFTRASLMSGKAFDRGAIMAGVDLMRSEATMASDLDFYKENAPYNITMAHADRLQFPDYQPVPVELPDGLCDRLDGMPNAELDGRCMRDSLDTISIFPKSEQVSLYINGRYDITDDIEASATIIGTDSTITSSAPFSGWRGTVINDLPGELNEGYSIARTFSHDELEPGGTSVEQTSWTFSGNIKGYFNVADSQWIWNFDYSKAKYESTQRSYILKKEGLVNWLFGDEDYIALNDSDDFFQVGNDFYQNGLLDNIFRPVSASEKDDLAGWQNVQGNSEADTFGFTLSGELTDFDVLYNPISFALRTEMSSQYTEIIPDERTLNGGWLNIGSLSSKGERDRKAIAVEFEIPVTEKFDVALATRFDNYSDASSISGAQTSQIRFSYKLLDEVMVRGGWSQTFRAPDMFNIYGESQGFNGVFDVTNENCYDQDGNFVCGATRITVTRTSDSSLKEESGTDTNFGIVWTPNTNFSLSATVYELDLEDLVSTENAQDLVNRQYSCQNGTLDPSSPTCQDVNSRITRDSINGEITDINVRPVNQQSMLQRGFDLIADYNYETDQMGLFYSRLTFSKYLAFDLERFEGEDTVDLRYGEPGLSTPSGRATFSLGWNKKLEGFQSVGMNLFVQRQGSTKNFRHTQYMEPYYVANLTGNYQYSSRLGFGLSINNVFAAEPQLNESGVWPNYWAHLQSPVGRSFNLSANYLF
ncbi:TonB-dependent receptor [Thalassotalea sp. LPB0316]|uniref:TonB-dependent receptor domain-containing protein n=1 Tax=Thalassotalea sp. LPB0316 TaxID=2769490 RepID=UPI001866381C|nr:TonB-dependent receptor [Thalassotalea sp. LPB0316]QOL26130.1 TonB-dependent receptor [Thalassotalea sp. LPB0316]